MENLRGARRYIASGLAAVALLAAGIKGGYELGQARQRHSESLITVAQECVPVTDSMAGEGIEEAELPTVCKAVEEYFPREIKANRYTGNYVMLTGEALQERVDEHAHESRKDRYALGFLGGVGMLGILMVPANMLLRRKEGQPKGTPSHVKLRLQRTSI